MSLSRERRLLTAGLFLLAMSIGACANESKGNETKGQEAQGSAESESFSLIPPLPEKAETGFSDVLLKYQAMNNRLERISAPLRLSNVGLCPVTYRDPGFSVHSLSDYPEALRPMAETLLGVGDEAIYIRHVRQGSPAAQADIQAGDQIVKVNGRFIPSGLTMQAFYEALSREAFGGVKARLTLKSPEGNLYETSLEAQTACAYDSRVFYSEDINGHTDGEEIFISSSLMEFVADDDSLALIVAHEMGHAIAGHIDKTPTAEIELQADRMALVLMANAGFDIDSAISSWAEAVHPHRELQDNSESHPSIAKRYENFQSENNRISNLQTQGKALTFK